MKIEVRSIALLVLGTCLATAAFGQRAAWRPDVDVYPMWLHADLSTQSGVSKAPDQKHFNAVWRVNGEMGRATYSYIYGELDGKSRSNLDLLTKEMLATVVNNPANLINRKSNDFDFNRFVSGAENGWKSIRARRMSFDTNLENKPRHFEALILTDGRSRVWTFLVNYAAGFGDGEAVASRLLDSVRIMNKIDVGDENDHYRASIKPGGSIVREMTGKYTGDQGG